jgi:hypothetical protein
MKHVKILAALAVAMSALGGTASADSFTSPTGTTYTGNVKSEAEGHAVLDNPIAKIECASLVQSEVKGHGAGKAVSGPIFQLLLGTPSGTCTDSYHVTVTAAGSLSVENNGAGYNGIVYSSGATITTTRFGIDCNYATSSTTIGTLTGGSPATLHISAAIPFHNGSVFCDQATTAWTGSYKVVSPTSLFVDNN